MTDAPGSEGLISRRPPAAAPSRRTGASGRVHPSGRARRSRRSRCPSRRPGPAPCSRPRRRRRLPASATREPMLTAIPPTSLTAALDLPGVQPDPHLEAHVTQLVADRDRAADRAGRRVEDAPGTPSPVDLISRPPWAPSSSTHQLIVSVELSRASRRSPTSAARSVDDTMSLNITVARIAVGVGAAAEGRGVARSANAPITTRRARRGRAGRRRGRPRAPPEEQLAVRCP